MEKYLGRFRRRAVADMTRQDCRELLDDLTRRSGRTTAAAVLRTVRALVNTAIRIDETIARNPVDAVRVPVPPRRQVDELDLPGFWDRTGMLSPVMRDLQRAFLLTGARRSSLLAVKRDDFDPVRGVLTFRHMKVGGAWCFPTGRWLTAALRARMEEDEPLRSGWAASTAARLIGRIAPPRKAHGYLSKSLFRTGFDQLRRLLRHDPDAATLPWLAIKPCRTARSRVV